MIRYKDKLEADLSACRATLRALEYEKVISDNMRLRIQSTLKKTGLEPSYPVLPQILCFFHWHSWVKKETRSLILYGLYRECTRCGRMENVKALSTRWVKVSLESYLQALKDGAALSEEQLLEMEHKAMKEVLTSGRTK